VPPRIVIVRLDGFVVLPPLVIVKIACSPSVTSTSSISYVMSTSVGVLPSISSVSPSGYVPPTKITLVSGRESSAEVFFASSQTYVDPSRGPSSRAAIRLSNQSSSSSPVSQSTHSFLSF